MASGHRGNHSILVSFALFSCWTATAPGPPPQFIYDFYSISDGYGSSSTACVVFIYGFFSIINGYGSLPTACVVFIDGFPSIDDGYGYVSNLYFGDPVGRWLYVSDLYFCDLVRQWLYGSDLVRQWLYVSDLVRPWLYVSNLYFGDPLGVGETDKPVKQQQQQRSER